MKAAAFLLAMIPTIAWAQQATTQASLPSLQQLLDQKSSQIFDAVAAMRGQIAQDNATITTVSQQNSELTVKNQTLEKENSNLQAQLKAATAKPDPAK